MDSQAVKELIEGEYMWQVLLAAWYHQFSYKAFTSDACRLPEAARAVAEWLHVGEKPEHQHPSADAKQSARWLWRWRPCEGGPTAWIRKYECQLCDRITLKQRGTQRMWVRGCFQTKHKCFLLGYLDDVLFKHMHGSCLETRMQLFIHHIVGSDQLMC